jgi:Domain of unknown function (DUF4404)
MPNRSIESHVAALRRELSNAESLDAETRRMLANVAEDIDTALEHGVTEDDSLRERIKAAAVHFEADHPRFAGILNDITDALATIGL